MFVEAVGAFLSQVPCALYFLCQEGSTSIVEKNWHFNDVDEDKLAQISVRSNSLIITGTEV
jgi:hypothetical protein